MREAIKASRQFKTQLLQGIKSVPCADCNKEYATCVMQFDHVNGTKEFNLSHAVRKNYSLDRIMNELAKCEIVCANCHALRTNGMVG